MAAAKKKVKSIDREKLIGRRWKTSDIPAIVACQKACYPDFAYDDLCDERNYKLQMKAFAEGLYLVEYQGEVVGYSASLIVTIEDDCFYDYAEITGNGTFTTHNPSGDTLYGADMAVLPEYRGLGISRILYTERKRLLKRLNLRRMVAGGRIPGYARFSGKLSAEDYVAQVVAGKRVDPTLTPQLKIGFTVKGVYMDYLTDQNSLNYATALEYPNPDYHVLRHQVAASSSRRSVRKVRVGAVQYRMHDLHSYEDFERQVDFFVRTAHSYGCHVMSFPELFTAQLFSLFPNLDGRDSVKKLMEYTPRYVELFTKAAKEYGMHIVGGSHPLQRGRKVYNSAYLFTPQGQVFHQDKIHLTAVETDPWRFTGGDKLQVFDIGVARIGILVCYDVEFPELSRLLALAGVEILIVPFSTDDAKAYMRVRYSAHARCIENAIYTVISGNSGNLTQINSFLMNYAHAAILTPSDYPFPQNAVLAESESQEDRVVVADLDLSSIVQVRDHGSVRPLRDLRKDLYEVKSSKKVERVRAY